MGAFERGIADAEWGFRPGDDDPDYLYGYSLESNRQASLHYDDYYAEFYRDYAEEYYRALNRQWQRENVMVDPLPPFYLR